MQWNASTSGGGLAFPLQNLMAASAAHRADQRLDLPEGGRHDRHAHQPGGRPAPRDVDQERLLPEDVNAIEYTDANARFGKGEGVFMFNGDWQNAGYDADCRARSASS